MSENHTDAHVKTNAKSDFGNKGWLVVIASFLACLFACTYENGLNFFVPALTKKYGWLASSVFSYTTIGSWFAIIGTFLGSALGRKKGGLAVIYVGLIPGIVSLVIMGATHNLVIYGIFSALFIVCSNLFFMVGISILVANWFPTKKGLVMGWVTMGVCGGSLAAQWIIQPVIRSFDVQTAFFGLAGFGVLIVLFFILCVKNTPEEAGAYPDNDQRLTKEEVEHINAIGEEYRKTSPWGSYKKCFTCPAIWIVGIAYGIMNLVGRGVFSQSFLAITSYGHSSTLTTICMSAAGIAAFVFSWIGGVMDQKIGPRRAMAYLNALVSVTCFLFAFLGKSPIMVVVLLLVTAFESSADNGMGTSIIAEIFGRYDFEIPFSAMLIINNVFSGIGFTLFSLVAEKASYSAAFVLCGCLLIIPCLMWSLAKFRYLGRPQVDGE